MYECKSKREREMVCSLAQFSPGAGGVLRPGYFCCLHVRHWWLLVSEILFFCTNQTRCGRQASLVWPRLATSVALSAPSNVQLYWQRNTSLLIICNRDALYRNVCSFALLFDLCLPVYTLFTGFGTWIHFQLDFRCAQILFSCKVKPLREIF